MIESGISSSSRGARPLKKVAWSALPPVLDVYEGSGKPRNRFLDGWNCIAELNAQNSALRTYTWGPDLSGSEQGAGGVGGLLSVTSHLSPVSTHFVAYNGNGDVAALVNAADGKISAEYEYGPFGEPIKANGKMAEANPYRFSSKYQDQESGLLYYGYRYYNPSTGRWPSRDPIGIRGGPNEYGFVRNNSINWVDPFGLAYFAYRPLDSFLGKLLGVWGSEPGSEDDKKNTVTAHEQIFFEDGKSPGDIGYFDDNTVRPDKSKVKYKPAHSSGWNDCVMRKAVAAVKPKSFCLLEEKGKEKYNCQDFSSAVRSEYRKLIKDPKVLAECCPTEAEKNK